MAEPALSPVKPTPGTIGAASTWTSALPQMPTATAVETDLSKAESGDATGTGSFSQPLLGDSYAPSDLDGDAQRNTRAKSIDSVVSFTSNVPSLQGDRDASERPLCCCSFLLPCSRTSCWHRGSEQQREKNTCCIWACGGSVS